MPSEFLEDYAGEFGKGFIRMVWRDEGLQDGINNGSERLMKKVDSLLLYYAPQVENWMKNNASWTDRTGAARNGLAARFFSDGSGRGIILYHQVPYGIWLEVRFSGRYAIINPALEEWGPRVMEGVRHMLDDMKRR